MTDAMSRLTDVDMAEEMTNYTHQNVLNQAAISVLTQANDLPQQDTADSAVGAMRHENGGLS